MALNLLSEQDFIGFLALDFDAYTNFNVWQQQVEKKVLTELYGKAMYEDYEANPTDAKYQALTDGSDTLPTTKDVILGFFYFYYVRNTQSNHTTIGSVVALAENADQDYKGSTVKSTSAWNTSLQNYDLQAQYVAADKTTYDKYTETKVKDYNDQWGI